MNRSQEIAIRRQCVRETRITTRSPKVSAQGPPPASLQAQSPSPSTEPPRTPTSNLRARLQASRRGRPRSSSAEPPWTPPFKSPDPHGRVRSSQPARGSRAARVGKRGRQRAHSKLELSIGVIGKSGGLRRQTCHLRMMSQPLETPPILLENESRNGSLAPLPNCHAQRKRGKSEACLQ